MIIIVGLLLSVSTAVAQDTDAWDALLREHVKQGRVDYQGLRAPKARKALKHVVNSFSDMPENASLADWINAYNALVIHGVVEHMPVKSVKAIDGFFKEKKTRVAGKPRSLDEIENEIIRPRFQDARVHAALNCAAASCPALYNRAYRDRDLDALLTERARQWVSHQAHVVVEGEVLRVSEIFFWFRKDFEREAGSIKNWIAQRVDRGAEAVRRTTRLERLAYDWRLNAAR